MREGAGHTLMKGLVNTEDFLRAVLDKENGLRTGRILSHLAVLEIPGERHLSFCADSGFIIAPTLKEKKYIIANSLRAIHALGYEHVNVAILAANERVNNGYAGDPSTLRRSSRRGARANSTACPAPAR